LSLFVGQIRLNIISRNEHLVSTNFTRLCRLLANVLRPYSSKSGIQLPLRFSSSFRLLVVRISSLFLLVFLPFSLISSILPCRRWCRLAQKGCCLSRHTTHICYLYNIRKIFGSNEWRNLQASFNSFILSIRHNNFIEYLNSRFSV